MKKLVLSIIAVLSAICLAFGISGCGFPQPDEISAAGGIILYNNFDDFKTFYNRKFVKANKERMYLLNPGENITQYPYSHNFFYIQGESLNDYTFENPVVKESFDVYYEEFGDNSGGQDGAPRHSFSVEAEFYSVSKKINVRNLIFSFESKLKVIIKINEEIIGTCKFYTGLEISQEWFKDYLKSSLI